MQATRERPKTDLRLGRSAPGLTIVGIGAWAFFSPSSFYDAIATYPPFNEHMLHDAGSFLIGLGVAWLAAMRWRDGWTVALLANASAAIMHAVAHVMDRDLGGRASDPWLLSLVAVSFVVAAARRFKGGAS